MTAATQRRDSWPPPEARSELTAAALAPVEDIRRLVNAGVRAGNPYWAVVALTLAYGAIEMLEGPSWAAMMYVAREDTMSATGALNTGAGSSDDRSAVVQRKMRLSFTLSAAWRRRVSSWVSDGGQIGHELGQVAVRPVTAAHDPARDVRPCQIDVSFGLPVASAM